MCAMDRRPDQEVGLEDGLRRSKAAEEDFNPFRRQVMAASGPLILVCSVGMMMGFPAVVLPQLQRNSTGEDAMVIGDEEASWIASISILPTCFSCIAGGFLMERYGRRRAQLTICVPLLAGWVLSALAANFEVLLAGRFLTGLVGGLLGPITNVYISETSEPRYRGLLICGISLSMAMGMLVEHALGTFLPWRVTAGICGIVPCVGGVLVYFSPESSAWLIGRGKLVQGEEAFFWSRGYTLDAKNELKAMLGAGDPKSAKSASRRSTKQILSKLSRRDFLEPLLLMVVFFATMQWSGTEAISAYAIAFIEESVGGAFDSYAAMLILDAVHVAVSVAACVLCKFCKRRHLVLVSGFGATLMMYALSLFIALARVYPSLDDYRAVTLACLVGHNVFVNLGLQPLSWTVSGEVFPNPLRSYGNAITSASAYLLLFSVIKTVPAMFAHLGILGTFVTYGSVTLVGTAVLAFILPETKDKTLQDIENYFKGDREVNGDVRGL